MSRGVGWQSALWARPLYRGPVAKRVAVSAGSASLGSIKKVLSGVESLSSLCPPYIHVLCFFFAFLPYNPQQLPSTPAGLRTHDHVEFDSPGWGRSGALTIPSQEAQVRSASQFWVGVVLYSFVERDRSSHFGFAPTSLRPLRTSVPHSLFFR